METLSGPGPTPLAACYQYEHIYRNNVPTPVLERGWLHTRTLRLAWDAERIIEKIGDQCWFSHYSRSKRDLDPKCARFLPSAIAGFWPSGGFVELELRWANQLDEHPRGDLSVWAESPARAEALMNALIEGYGHEAKPSLEARIGVLHLVGDHISVERIPVTINQTVQREQLDLYYGDGMASWAEDWLQALNTRRYGLTILTGDPGTGKTTLVRSLAHWLGASHVFYFMPAARFANMESGAIVTFLADENRNSKLRKVLILEDAESILQRRADDNREKVATLLNLTDGMLGDALGLHVICTLNSELTELDPALLRPGRLVAHRDFCPLSAEDAGRLAAVLGLDAPAAVSVSLAEIFNPATGKSISPCTSRRVMGFHAVLP